MLISHYIFLVIDGSVLKNDIKQKLAKERREEKQRQDGMFSIFLN